MHLQIPGARRVKKKQLPYQGSTTVEGPVSVTVLWHFLLGASELILIFVCKEKNFSNYSESI
jgi:hypothetical protein